MTERKTTTTADERAAKVAAIKESAEAKLAAMIESGDFREYVRVAAKFHRYSVANQCLILSQMPHAEQVASFKTWLDLGRPVKKGEHGIRIWAPSIPRASEQADDDETEEQPKNKSKRRQHARAFHLVPVFDVSQTDGDPLPEHPCKPLDDDPANAAAIIRHTNQLAAAIVAKGVTIIDDDSGHPTRGGYWQPSTKTIAIKPTENNAARFRVLLHEAAHMLAEHGGKDYAANRGDCEAVAELAAHIAAGALGYDTSTASVGYVATWAGGDMARVKANMNEAMRVVRELLAMMPDDSAPKPKPSQAPALKIERPTSAAAVIAGEPLTFNFCQECGRPLDYEERHNPVCPECQTPEPTPPASARPDLDGITIDNADEMLGAAQDRKAEQLRALRYFDNPERCEREHADELKKIRAELTSVYVRVLAVRNEARRQAPQPPTDPAPTSAPIVIAQTRHVDASGQEIEGSAKTIAAERPARKRTKKQPYIHTGGDAVVSVTERPAKNTPAEQPTPRTDELERQAKSGQPISLTALADAIKADKAENAERANAEQSAAAPAVPAIAPRAAVLTKELKAALSAIKPASPGKTALPILKCVRIDARDGQLTISATNLEIGITRTVPAIVDAPFSVCFDYKQFAAAVPAGNDVIHITPDGAGAMAKIEKQSADDFPVMPEPSGTSAEVDAGELAAAVRAVTHAAADDDSRPVLAAVNIRVKDGFAELAAADGFRLAVSQPFPLPLPNNFRILPPARALAAWAGLKMTGKVRLGVTERQAQFFIQDDRTTFLARTIDGTFPDYRQIIPRESAVTVRLDPRQLADACKQIAPIVKDNNDVLRLTIARETDAEECRLTASGKSSEGAEIALSVPMLAATMPYQTDAPPYQIAFNVKYLADVCKHAAGPLTFGFTTPSHAAKITDDVSTFVLMPMVV